MFLPNCTLALFLHRLCSLSRPCSGWPCSRPASACSDLGTWEGEAAGQISGLTFLDLQASDTLSLSLEVRFRTHIRKVVRPGIIFRGTSVHCSKLNSIIFHAYKRLMFPHHPKYPDLLASAWHGFYYTKFGYFQGQDWSSWGILI